MKKLMLLLSILCSSYVLNSCSNSDVADMQDLAQTEVLLQPQTSSQVKVMSRCAGDLDAPEFYKVQDGKEKLPPEYQDAVPADTAVGEYAKVMEYLRLHPNEGSITCNLTTYFIQNIGSSFAKYTGEDMNHHPHEIVGGSHMDYMVINGEHIYDFNAVSGPCILCVNLPLNNPSYHESYGNNMFNEYRYYTIDGNLYLCFDYKTIGQNGNVEGDGIFNDWVVKITDASGDKTPDITPVPPTNEGEVEVNLSITVNKDTLDYIASKTSIHVRDTTDFTMFIPVPAQYYCQKDDMYIVAKHDVAMVYNSFVTTMTYTINEQEVKLTITYEQNGIKITSKGINNKVLEYCRQYYGDGVTFEIWNYYYGINKTDLQPKLNQSYIIFDNKPKTFKNTILIDLDCIVTEKDK